MTGRVLALVVAAVLGVAVLCSAGVAALTGAAATCTLAAASGGSGGYDADQLHYAQIIVIVGAQRGVPVRGQIIAVATARQESGLRNLGDLGARNDHDSLGLFQQRPSQGWGTPAQIMDPVYAAGAFYDRLLRIPGWQTLPLTEAAQAVQRSAYPDAYAKWEGDATRIVLQLSLRNPSAGPVELAGCPNPCQPTATAAASSGIVATAGTPPCEWVAPVDAPIVSGFRTTDRPSHQGVDLGAARGTPIRAASAGVVTVVRCNITPASHGCDRDGSPATPGCGWYVQIRHEHDILTRYCHMIRQPSVMVGEHVTTGQIIGYVGSSGHSSGPHLHFEVHVNNDSSDAGAIDPVPFMASRAPLGKGTIV